MKKTIWACAWMALVGGVVLGAEAGAVTQPNEGGIVMTNGDKKAVFEFWQEGKQVKADDKGEVHLKQEAFEIRVVGDLDQAGMMGSTTEKLVDQLQMEKRPVGRMGGTGAAFEKGDLLVQEDVDLVSWEDANTKENMADQAQEVKNAFGEMPVLLDGIFQPVSMYAENRARETRFEVGHIVAMDNTKLFSAAETKIKKMAWEDVKEVWVVFQLTEGKKEGLATPIAFKGVHVVFDVK